MLSYALLFPLPPGVSASARYSGFGVYVWMPQAGKRLLISGGIQDGTRTSLVLNSETGRAVAWMTNYESIPDSFGLLMSSTILGILGG